MMISASLIPLSSMKCVLRESCRPQRQHVGVVLVSVFLQYKIKTVFHRGLFASSARRPKVASHVKRGSQVSSCSLYRS